MGREWIISVAFIGIILVAAGIDYSVFMVYRGMKRKSLDISGY